MADQPVYQEKPKMLNLDFNSEFSIHVRIIFSQNKIKIGRINS